VLPSKKTRDNKNNNARRVALSPVRGVVVAGVNTTFIIFFL